MQSIGKIEKEIVICDITNCLNCGNCIVACKRRHHDVSRHTRAASTVIGISLFPNLCMVCDDPKCIEACNHKGLERDEQGNIVVTSNCIGCGLCMRACPYNAILLFSEQEGKSSFIEKVINFVKPREKEIRGDHNWEEKDVIDLKKLEKLIEGYREGPGSLINLLLKIQDEYTYLPLEALKHVSNKLTIPLLQIYHIITFYKEFNTISNRRHGLKGVMGTTWPIKGYGTESKENEKDSGLKKNGFTLSVNGDKCISCGLCVRVCKEIVGACAMRFSKQGLYGEIHKAFLEFPEFCTGCGECAKVCPTKAITFEDKKAGSKQRVVVKCDCCAGYNDRACVINCPTGALRTVHIEEYFAKHKESLNIELRELIKRSLEREIEELEEEDITPPLEIKIEEKIQEKQAAVAP